MYKICAALEIEVVEILPTNAEVTQPSTVLVELDGDVRHIPPKTAEALKQLQEPNRKGGKVWRRAEQLARQEKY